MSAKVQNDDYLNGIVDRLITDKPVSDTELLTLLMARCMPIGSAKEYAAKIICKYGSISYLSSLSYQQLTSINGIEPMVARDIKILKAGTVNSLNINRFEDISVKTVADAIRVVKLYFMDSSVERLFLILVNSRNEVINFSEIAFGGESKVEYDIQTILEKVTRYQAKKVYLIHNHIKFSGPSSDDITNTRKLGDFIYQLGAEFEDHLIFCNGEMFSMRRNGFLDSEIINTYV